MWAKLKNVPVLWPVEIHKRISPDSYKVFVESDDAILMVKMKDCVPFEEFRNHTLHLKAIEKLKKSKLWKTLDAFEKDYDRACRSEAVIQSRSPGGEVLPMLRSRSPSPGGEVQIVLQSSSRSPSGEFPSVLWSKSRSPREGFQSMPSARSRSPEVEFQSMPSTRGQSPEVEFQSMPSTRSRSPEVESQSMPSGKSQSPEVESQSIPSTRSRSPGVECQFMPSERSRSPGVESQSMPSAISRSPEVEFQSMPSTRSRSPEVEFQSMPSTRGQSPEVEFQSMPSAKSRSPEVEFQSMPSTRSQSPEVEFQSMPSTRSQSPEVEFQSMPSTRSRSPEVEFQSMPSTRSRSPGVEFQSMPSTRSRSPGVEFQSMPSTRSRSPEVEFQSMPSAGSRSPGVEFQSMPSTRSRSPGVEFQSMPSTRGQSPEVEFQSMPSTRSRSPEVEFQSMPSGKSQSPEVESQSIPSTRSRSPGVESQFMPSEKSRSPGVESQSMPSAISRSPEVEFQSMPSTRSRSPEVEFQSMPSTRGQSPEVEFQSMPSAGSRSPEVEFQSMPSTRSQSPEVEFQSMPSTRSRSPEVEFQSMPSTRSRSPGVEFQSMPSTRSRSPGVEFQSMPSTRSRSPEVESQSMPSGRSHSPEVESQSMPSTRSHSPEVEFQSMPSTRSRSPEIESQSMPSAGSRSPEVEFQSMPSARSHSPEVEFQSMPSTRSRSPEVEFQSMPSTRSQSPEVESQSMPSARSQSPEVESQSMPSTRSRSPEVEFQSMPSTRSRSPGVEFQSMPSTRGQSPEVEFQSMPSARSRSPGVEFQSMPSTRSRSPEVEFQSMSSTRSRSPGVEFQSMPSGRSQSPEVESLSMPSARIRSPVMHDYITCSVTKQTSRNNIGQDKHSLSSIQKAMSESSDDSDFVEDSVDEDGTDVGLVCEGRLREKHKEFDINTPNIYIRKYRKSKKCITRQPKKGSRVYDNYHACLFCGELRQHIKTHLQTHKENPEVRKLLQDENTDYTKIRKLGDHKNNVKVLKNGCGEIILGRRPKIFDISQFDPCPECKEWLLLRNIKTHYRKCSSKKTHISKGQLIIQSQVISGVISSKPSKLMLEEVFPRMLRDEISEVAQKDVLIVALGESWLRRSIDNRAKRRHYASEHMRLLARLLIEIRKLVPDGKKTLSEYLTTKYFEEVLTAVLNCCVPNMDDIEELESPSNAIKLKYDIRRVVNAKWSFLVKEDPHSREAQEMQTLLGLLTLEWGERLTKLARAVLVRRRFVMKKELPSPEDIASLTKYTAEQLNETDLTPGNFFRIVQLSQTRLLTFNKRRSGEIDVISLASYAAKTKDIDEMDHSLVSDLTKVELHLLKSQEMMTVRGKGHRPVPVLIPEEMQKPLKYISSPSAREAVGIQRNEYLFPNKVGQYTRAYESLKKTCSECNLVAPGRITSVTMRKYTATLAQVLNLDKYQLDWLCRHLGHSSDVHKVHYRHMSGLIERVQMAKLFLVQDLNLVGKFKGKKLEEIDVSDIVFSDKDEDIGDSTEVHNQVETSSTSYLNDDVFNNMEEESDVSAYTSGEDGPEQLEEKRAPLKKKPVNRTKWDAQEMDEIQMYFGSFLDLKKCPRKKAIEVAKKQSKANGGKILKRTNDKIVKKISNMNRK